MAKTRSMTRKEDHDASPSSTRKRFKTSDMDGVVSWSDINHDVLFIVMMKLGVIDFLAFSGVCKSWRSLTLSNRNTFMASRPPMSFLDMDPHDNNQDSYCYLKDFEGRRFKTILPHFAGRFCIGVTCGYMILFGKETRDFWLVNPITRHQLHFTDYPFYKGDGRNHIRAILVFSDSVSRWVLVTLRSGFIAGKISFCIECKRRWNHVSSADTLIDLHAFKGKIYNLHIDCYLYEPKRNTLCSLHELKLNVNRKCKSTFCKIMGFQNPLLCSLELFSSGENLFMVNWGYKYNLDNHVLKFDLGEMKLVSPENQHAFFLSCWKSCAAIKPESWAGLPPQYKSYYGYLGTDISRQHMAYYKYKSYFPHDCLNVNFLDE